MKTKLWIIPALLLITLLSYFSVERLYRPAVKTVPSVVQLQEKLTSELQQVERQKPKAAVALKKVEALEPLETVATQIHLNSEALEVLESREDLFRSAIGELQILQADTEKALSTSLQQNQALTEDLKTTKKTVWIYRIAGSLILVILILL